MPDNEIDLDIAFRKLHKLALEDGDLGREYWYGVSQLQKRAASMQAQIDALSRELDAYKAKPRK